MLTTAIPDSSVVYTSYAVRSPIERVTVKLLGRVMYIVGIGKHT